MGRKILNVITTVILILLVALVIFIFIARLSGQVPSILGYHVFRVQTGSMEPTLAVGDVILVKECKPEDIHLGDIITYRSDQGQTKGAEVTHQVIKDPYEENGVWHIQTQGIANSAADPEITFDQVEGKYVRTIPYINNLYSFFLSPGGLIVFIAVIVVLFGYEMISLVMSYKSIDEEDDDYYAPPNRKPKKKRKK